MGKRILKSCRRAQREFARLLYKGRVYGHWVVTGGPVEGTEDKLMLPYLVFEMWSRMQRAL